MTHDYKKRVELALLRNSAKQLKMNKPKAKRMKPEKDVERECLVWMRARGWDVAIYESKATYNKSAQRYISQSMNAGTADCMGTLPGGTALYVEFKAKGRLNTFAKLTNARQQQFLISKIKQGAFACVVDSAELLSTTFESWTYLRQISTSRSQNYLMEQLPLKKESPLDFGI